MWQLSRERAADGLRLWRFPAIEARLTGLVASYPEAERAARAELAEQLDPNAEAVVRALARELSASETQVAEPVTDVIDAMGPEVPSPSDQRTFALAKSWPGLVVTPAVPFVAAGTQAAVGIASEHRGEHRLAVGIRTPVRPACRMPIAAN